MKKFTYTYPITTHQYVGDFIKNPIKKQIKFFLIHSCIDFDDFPNKPDFNHRI